MESCREEVVVSKPEATPVPSPLCQLQENPWGSFSAFGCNMKGNERKLVCLTGGNSYLGSHILKHLLARGYLVRLALQNPVEVEEIMNLKGMEVGLERVVLAKFVDVGSLGRAFTGCDAVFHTSSFDPRGVSGYSETMAFLETEVARNVIEACGRAASVKRCIFTSSLLASIWQSNGGADGVIDESCWSDEEFCRYNKLWLALGKTTAEKIAWRKSKEMKINLVTVCPGLLMAPTFPNAHTEAFLPYVKGGQLMLEQGVLATVNVNTAAKAHVDVYEAMDHGACGRYFCFDKVVKRLDEVIELENGLKMQGLLSRGRHAVSNNEEEEEERHCSLSNARLAKLVSYACQPLSCKQ